MAERFHEVQAEGIRLTVDLAVGHVRRLAVDVGGRRLEPLHTAPWVDDPVVAADPSIAPNLKFLSGDFFCAPFSGIEAGSPPHGWPANSAWRLLGEERADGTTIARFELEKPVMGARLVKEIVLRDGHPFAYVRHVFAGGSGAVPVASHAMTRFAGTGTLSFSPKAFAELPAAPLESDPARGRSLFATGRRFTDLSRLPLADGTAADLHRYPLADGHEDFVILVEAEGAALGWTAALRPDAGDIVLSLKNPRDFPVTFLWYSNGGRFYLPWNGRHRGVLGIEEGRAWPGHAQAANPLADAGIPTALTLAPDGTASVRHVIGAVPLPPGWRRVETLSIDGGDLVLTGDGGESRVPFDAAFLSE